MPVGLSGPVEQVLTGAPQTGPVRIVTVARGADGQPHVTVTTAPDRAHAADAVTRARAVPGAIAVSVDHEVHAADVGKPVPVTAASLGAGTRVRASGTPVPSNDTYRSGQWAMDTLQAETAWGLHTATGQTVAVIDTGVDGTHPDLAGILLPGTDVLGQYPDGRTDPEGHGTHVAGIVDGIANNGIGVAGLGQNAQVLPVRVLGADGSGWNSDVATGIIWAADHGATVISMSLGSTSDDPDVDSAIRYARNVGVVVVAAAGNEQQNGNPAVYPGAVPGVVAVAATDQNNVAAGFSESGPQIAIAAPGVSITSTYPVARGSYASMSGTSMATPYVSAAAALLRSAAPGLTPDQVAAVLTSTATDLGSPGRDDIYGAGLLNPVAALRAAQSGAVVVAAPWAPTDVAAVAAPNAATVSWSAPADGGSPIIGYTVVASPGGATVTTSGATSASVTGLTNGSAYTFTVTATNAVGTGPASVPSASVTPASAPSAPTGVAAVAGKQAATVSWSAPADGGGSPITGYIVVASPGGATVTTSGATSAKVAGLASGTAYTFTVTATNAIGTGPTSVPSAPVTPAPATAPGAPGQVSAQPGNSTALVSWSAPDDDGGTPITGYTVVAAPGGATVTTSGATSATVTGLTNGTAYSFSVTATNAVGTGPASTASSAITPVVPPVDRLVAGQRLASGQQLVSLHGQYRLVMQPDGNPVVYGPGQSPLWYPRTWGHAGAQLVLQADGNLVVYAADGSVLWHSDTWGNPAATLTLQDDGNLVLYNSAHQAIWFTGWAAAPPDTLFDLQQLTAGQALTSTSGRYRMLVQADGNIVVYDSGQRAVWSTRTWGSPGARLKLQADGNLVSYTAGRAVAWSAGAWGNAGDSLVLQNDGNLVLYSAGGRALWASWYGRLP